MSALKDEQKPRSFFFEPQLDLVRAVCAGDTAFGLSNFCFIRENDGTRGSNLLKLR